VDILTPKLIVGLGNPGPKYRYTRHNAGFLVLEKVARSIGPPIEQGTRFNGQTTTIRHSETTIVLLAPMTFMNRSGESVAEAIDGLGLAPDDILVIYDCLDLPLGRLRLRMRGSSGGHRGMESIIDCLGVSDFPRLRVGIGRPEHGETIDYVLSPWTEEELPDVATVLSAAAEAVKQALSEGLEKTMNIVNSQIYTEHADSSPQ